MKKILKLSFTLMFIFTFFNSYSAEIDTSKIFTVAENYYAHYAPETITDYSRDNYSILSFNDTTGIFSNTVNMYIINFTSGGWVAMSTNNESFPVLGYSHNGELYADSLVDGTKFLFNDYLVQILYRINDSNFDNKFATVWNSFEENVFYSNKSTGVGTPVPPLLASSSSWSGQPPYFAPAPFHNYALCVPTALSQLSKYWEYPISPKGDVYYLSGVTPYYIYFDHSFYVLLDYTHRWE